MKNVACRFAVVVSLLASSASFARAITIQTVLIGNPGNPPDTRYLDVDHPNGVGSVTYAFRMGKTEITNAQYVAFLNAVAASDPYGLYSNNPETQDGIIRSGSEGGYSYAVKAPALGGTYTYDNKPVVNVSWGDAARFANWLHNGRPIGPQDASTTEDGAYTLNGAMTNAALNAATRNPGAKWWIPSEDEWYKAAYHKNDGVTANYWDYATGTNDLPNNNLPVNDTGNSANYYDRISFDGGYTTGDPSYPMTESGAYTLSGSPYGTFDQNGNVWEWNETLFGSSRGGRGGSWPWGPDDLHASTWESLFPTWEIGYNGFRVATIAVPEPGGFLLAALGVSAIFIRRRLRR